MKDHIESFSVHHFAFDGEALGSHSFQVAQLSPRWLGVCSALLEANGPVFDQNMGSTLEHYQLKCTGGICHFSVSSAPALFAAIVPSPNQMQSEAVLSTFAAHVGSFPLVKQQCKNVAAFLHAIAAVSDRPALIVVNWFNAEVQEQDQEAIFQLALHFAAAYLQFGAAQPGAAADGSAAAEL